MDLFTHSMQQRMKNEAPLAARMRPRTLDEAAKEQRSPGRRRSSGRASSCAGRSRPTGTGKMTLAMVIANLTKSHFETLSAVLAGKAELREVLEVATERRKLCGERTILFVKDVLQTLN